MLQQLLVRSAPRVLCFVRIVRSSPRPRRPFACDVRSRGPRLLRTRTHVSFRLPLRDKHAILGLTRLCSGLS